MEGHEPGCADIFSDTRRHQQQGKGKVINYLVCNNEATLLYMINLGCIDINPWASRKSQPEQPDYIIIDLDPSDEDFKKVIPIALMAKKVCDKHKLRTFPKTSGRSGLHIYIPCSGFNNLEVRSICAILRLQIQKLAPTATTLEFSKSSRGNKVYIDNHNDYADTIAAPYSVRPYHIPAVSAPLDWKEVNSKLDSKVFTIKTMISRLQTKGDLFKELLSNQVKARNNKILKTLIK